MSKISRDKKKAEAKAEAKGKQAKIAKSKAKKAAAPKEEKLETKPSVINGDRCCHCKHYKKYDICGHYCDVTNKPTPRKSTCKNHAFKS